MLDHVTMLLYKGWPRIINNMDDTGKVKKGKSAYEISGP